MRNMNLPRRLLLGLNAVSPTLTTCGCASISSAISVEPVWPDAARVRAHSPPDFDTWAQVAGVGLWALAEQTTPEERAAHQRIAEAVDMPIAPELAPDWKHELHHDSSTNALIRRYRAGR